MNAYVYILECADGSLYTGWTNDIDKRLKAHNDGTASKYTRSRRPVRLYYLEKCADKSTALKREMAIKKMPRCRKMQLPKENTHAGDLLFCQSIRLE